MSFAASVHCMDGRIQQAVIDFVKSEAGVDYVDAITEAGPVGALAAGDEQKLLAVAERLRVSVEKHGAERVFVSAHHDCAGNPVDKEIQIGQIRKSIELLEKMFPSSSFTGLWIDENFAVEVIERG
jgi:hypothetical protein